MMNSFPGELKICCVFWKCKGVDNLIFEHVCTLMASEKLYSRNKQKCLYQMVPVKIVTVSDSIFLRINENNCFFVIFNISIYGSTTCKKSIEKL